MLLRIIAKIYEWMVCDMAIVYATLILKGYRTFNDVPGVLQPQVKEVLTQLDAAALTQPAQVAAAPTEAPATQI